MIRCVHNTLHQAIVCEQTTSTLTLTQTPVTRHIHSLALCASCYIADIVSEGENAISFVSK